MPRPEVNGTTVLQERGREWRRDELPLLVRIEQCDKHILKHRAKMVRFYREGDMKRAHIEADLYERATKLRMGLQDLYVKGFR